jgi:hypothetical protein
MADGAGAFWAKTGPAQYPVTASAKTGNGARTISLKDILSSTEAALDRMSRNGETGEKGRKGT